MKNKSYIINRIAKLEQKVIKSKIQTCRPENILVESHRLLYGISNVQHSEKTQQEMSYDEARQVLLSLCQIIENYESEIDNLVVKMIGGKQ